MHATPAYSLVDMSPSLYHTVVPNYRGVLQVFRILIVSVLKVCIIIQV